MAGAPRSGTEYRNTHHVLDLLRTPMGSEHPNNYPRCFDLRLTSAYGIVDDSKDRAFQIQLSSSGDVGMYGLDVSPSATFSNTEESLYCGGAACPVQIRSLHSMRRNLNHLERFPHTPMRPVLPVVAASSQSTHGSGASTTGQIQLGHPPSKRKMSRDSEMRRRSQS